jgi:NitT/TauT family transport system substrate-binding protein
MSLRIATCVLLAGALLSSPTAAKAQAEASEVRIAKQYGIGYLPLMIMEHEKLLEKHAKAAGLPDISVTWATFTGAGAMNDALLSGGLDLAAIGPPAIVLLWAKTRGSPQEIKGVCSLTSMPLLLNTRDPNVKSIKDLSAKNKIAIPAVKISTMAVILQMASEKEFGAGNHGKLDHLTITRAHPDAMVALLSGQSEIDSHFTWPPFQYRELKAPGVRTILNSFDITEGPATTVAMAAPARFRNANPKTTKAFIAAMDEANNIIRSKPKQAAEIYLKVAADRDTAENIMQMLNADQFTTTPQRMMLFAEFLHKVGAVKDKPGSWKEMFYTEVHHLPGT